MRSAAYANMPESFFERVLRRLVENEVEFLVVGGMAAVLQGAPIVTQDLDVCYRRTRSNVDRLAKSLDPFAIALRTPQGPLPIRLDAQFLWNGCNFTLTADGEDLDLLGEMSGLGGYDQVFGHAPMCELLGMKFSLLALSDLIITKTAAGRPKDLAVLPLLEELRRSSGQGQG